MDFFIDNMVRKSIINIIEHKDTLPNDTQVWKNLTRLMFKNYLAYEVYGMVEECLNDSADEQWLERKYPKGFFKENFVFPKRSVIKINLKKAQIRKKINDNLKITDVAKSYGIIIKNKKAPCPFHDDKEPSLSFSNEKNVFNCFGCKAKGDIVTFKRRMNKWEKERKQKKNS